MKILNLDNQVWYLKNINQAHYPGVNLLHVRWKTNLNSDFHMVLI